VFAHNSGGSTKHFSLWWYDKSATTEIGVVLEYNLASKTYFQLDGNSYVFLEEGDEIRVKSETGSSVSVIVTVEQAYKPTTQHGF
jgi:formylmethanofuran dehydrogenase subunit D